MRHLQSLMFRRQLLEHNTAERRQRALTTFVGELRPKSILRKMSYRLGSARGGTLRVGWGMTILLVQPTAGASRSIARAQVTPGRQLWAHPGRIVESRFRLQCDYFVWNSEVGKRTIGISTFWFQSICQNHIVWDAVDVVEFTRKHTGKVREALGEIRSAIETLVAKRDQRKDGFAKVIAKAMETTYGTSADEVQSLLTKAGFTKVLAKKAAEVAEQKGHFTVWSVVDALTQLSRNAKYAGARTEADQKASSLLALSEA